MDSQLRILQPVSSNSTYLNFRVLHTSRESAPLYTALSYTWGNGQASEMILLDGNAFLVSLNLWSALHYLCLHAEHAKWTHIWVDAICINQASDSEKSAQVRRMDETYRRAACVSVWLGLVSGHEEWRQRCNIAEPTRTYDVDPFDWGENILELGNRPYWSRFWVIQEFLLAGNVEIYCSGNRINWLDFKEILGHATGTNSLIDQDPFEPDNVLAESCAAFPLVVARHPDKHPEFFRSLYDLLVEHHRSKSKDPRDRVFALLGMVNLEERSFLERYFPDYSLLKEHVAMIALAHVLAFETMGHYEVTTKSDGLFLGLGFDGDISRKKLLRRAKDLDYIGCDGIFEIRYRLEQADLERYAINLYSDDEEDSVSCPADRSRGSVPGIKVLNLLKIPVALSIGLGVCWYIKWR